MLVRKHVWIIVGVAFLVYAVYWTAFVDTPSMLEGMCGASAGVGCLYMAFKKKT